MPDIVVYPASESEVQQIVDRTLAANSVLIPFGGDEHAPWLEQDISAPGVHLIDGLFSAMDSGQNLNPGKIVVK